MKRPLGGDETGVATVVGGLLMAGILLVTLVTIQVEYVPVWEKDAEAARMRVVIDQYAALKAEVDRQLGNESQAPSTSPISMAAGRPASVFSSPGLPSTLEFVEADKPFKINATVLLIQTRNGNIVESAEESWTQVSSEPTVGDIALVESLRAKIPSASTGGDKSVSLEITDGDGLFAGRLEAIVERDPPDIIFRVKVTGADNGILHDQGFAHHQGSGPDTWFINAMDPDYRFDRLISSATKPLTLTFSQTNAPSSEYAVTYATSGAAGIVVGGAGTTVNNYDVTHAAGTLRLQAPNNHYVQQNILMENGAVLVEQDGTAIFQIAPHFNVATASGYMMVDMTIPSLVGAGSAVSGDGTAKVLTKAESHGSISALAPSITFTVSTLYPTLWTEHWNETLSAAGYSQGTGHYALSTTADQAILTLYGPTTAPASTKNDLALNLRQADIDVKILS